VISTRGEISFSMICDPMLRDILLKITRIEAGSAPPGGFLSVESRGEKELKITMSSDDPSTLRAMLNSYLGLLSAARDAGGTR
jgi:hypothetical protein